MTVRSLIETRNTVIATCDAACSVGEAVSILAERRFGALPVVENGEVVGIFPNAT